MTIIISYIRSYFSCIYEGILLLLFYFMLIIVIVIHVMDCIQNGVTPEGNARIFIYLNLVESYIELIYLIKGIFDLSFNFLVNNSIIISESLLMNFPCCG